MKLALYIARVYAASIFLSMLLLVVLVTSVTLIENAGYLVKVEEGASIALRLAMFEAVEYAYQVLPVTTLLGALVTGVMLARSGEFLAMQAAGMGPVKILAPCLGVTLLAAGLGVVSGEWGVPWALKKAETIRVEHMRRSSALSRFYNRRTHWFKDGTRVMYLPAVNLETGVFSKPSIYDLSNGVVREVIDAETMEQLESGWTLKNVHISRIHGVAYEKMDELQLDMQVSARDLIDVTGNPRHVSWEELTNLILRREHAGFDNAAHRLEQHNRLAFPLLALWLFLVAAPWIVDPDRRRSMAVNLGGGVVAIALVLSGANVFRLLALGRQIYVPLGAWGVGLVCAGLIPLSWALQRRARIRGSIF
ncbi:MAG: LptF/LptG family permease [Myxococcota bacterium]|nr:LptF/LptG family permease [Myxococcota bacterium]